MFYLETRQDLVATAAYQPEPTAAAEARRFVRDTLRSWDLTGCARDLSARSAPETRETPGPLDVPSPREGSSQREGSGTADAREVPGSLGRPDTWGALDALVDDAVLLTSELVTNAVLHAGTPVQVTCRLLADARISTARGGLHGWAVEIAVLDRRPALLHTDLPHSAAEAAERVSGRGLLLPAELASAWGVTYARAAKAVWFRMALPEP